MLFSLIVPVYNTREYLHQCLDSLLAQTYPDFEAVLVDDGSTDGSGEILDEYAARDARLKVIHQENGGVVSACKAGARVAAGEYVTRLDSDDYIAPNFLERFAEEMGRMRADMYACGHTRVEQDGSFPTRRMTSVRGGEGLFDRGVIENELLSDIKRMRLSLWGVFIRREIFAKFQMMLDNRIKTGEDSTILFCALSEADSMKVMLDPLYFYRIREGSLMRTKGRFVTWENVALRFEVLEKVLPMQKGNLRDQFNSLAISGYFRVAVSHFGHMGYFEAARNIRQALARPEVGRYFERMPATRRRDVRAAWILMRFRLLTVLKVYQCFIERHLPFWKKFFPKLK